MRLASSTPWAIENAFMEPSSIVNPSTNRLTSVRFKRRKASARSFHGTNDASSSAPAKRGGELEAALHAPRADGVAHGRERGFEGFVEAVPDLGERRIAVDGGKGV